MRSVAILLIIAGIILLQVFLSRKASKWPGRVLPILSFAFSFLYVLNVQRTDDRLAMLGTMAIAFLVGNIPTAALLGIYELSRKKLFRS